MARLAQDLVAGAAVHCEPDYIPHPKHTHSVVEHSRTPTCRFYIVLTGEHAAVYTDFSQIQEILNHFPDTKYDSLSDWLATARRWRQNCDKHHDHWDEWRSQLLSSRSSSPLSSFDASIGPTPPPSRTPSPDLTPISRAAPLFDTPAHSRTKSSPAKEALRSPALRSPAPSTTSAASQVASISSLQRHQRKSPSSIGSLSSVGSSPSIASQFPPPIYPSHPTLLPFPARLLPEQGIYPPESHRIATRSASLALSSLSSGTTSTGTRAEFMPSEEDACPAPAHASGTTGPLVYAVSACNLVFKTRSRAVQLFEETDGAEIFLGRSVDEISGFLEKAWPHRPITTYAVSGHRVIFKNRERAYNVFLEKQGAEMLFACSYDEAEALLIYAGFLQVRTNAEEGIRTHAPKRPTLVAAVGEEAPTATQRKV
ncbi:hypothetical protein C8R43DRAFT_941719 [Mycena crocata]|nr:hypothetical protein C8R43DRAFT_941719 [Mycena crocata]